MRITVRSDEHNFRLWLPNRLFLNPVSAAICVKALRSRKLSVLQDDIPYFAMLKLFRAIRKSRHLLQGQPLVRVNSANGEIVEIWI